MIILNNKYSQLSLVRSLWLHIDRKRRLQLVLFFIITIISSAAEVVSIGAVVPFLAILASPDHLFRQEGFKFLVELFSLREYDDLMLSLTILFILATLLSGLTRLTLLWTQTRLGYAIGTDLSINIFRRTLHQDYVVHLGRNSSEIIAAISTKVITVVNYIILPVLNICSAVIITSSILYILFAINSASASLAFFGFGSLYFLIILTSRKYLMRDSQLISQQQNQTIKLLQEGLGGIRDVLLDGTQEVYCNAFKKSDSALKRATANVQIVTGSPRFVIEALGMILIALMAYSMSDKSNGVASAIPVLGALALGAQRLLPSMQQAYAGLTSIRAAKSSLIDVIGLLNQPIKELVENERAAPLTFNREIRFENISFRYSNNAPFVLKKLNLSIQKGIRLGIIGSTGSGKSTLLDILMGLLSPTNGQLIIDGTPLDEAGLRAWRSNIAHVPQSIYLVDSTISENIAFGVPAEHIDLLRVQRAAKEAQIAEYIESLDSKYETVIGERGVRLSGGQRQRIGIARALYKKTDVIILDEATSALDNETELAVMKSVESLSQDLTIIIVAHRLSTLCKCSQIIELNQGKVSNSGTYQDIISNKIN